MRKNSFWQSLGLMSGSSLDGIDLALCEFELDIAEGGFTVPKWSILRAETIPFSEEWADRLRALPEGSARELARAHTDFGRYCGAIIHQFLSPSSDLRLPNSDFRLPNSDFRLPNSAIRNPQSAIVGFHGHTIFHHPEQGFTTQLGDGAAVAATTGITTVSNFRDLDVALGGQGAPLAPVADKYLYPGYDLYLNLGGIANLTAILTDKIVAFDVCPANQLLDPFAREAGHAFDRNGALASYGRVQPGLLQRLNALDYYQRPYPRSLDNAWSREQIMTRFGEYDLSVEDCLRTGVEHITSQIHLAIQNLLQQEEMPHATSLLATGGGAHNLFLMRRLQEKLEPLGVEIVLPTPLQIDFKEAALMAFLAVLRMEGLPNVISSVTGASRDAVCGAISVAN